MKRQEQVKADVETVLNGRADLLRPLAGGHLFISGGTGFLGTWLLELMAVLNDRYAFNSQVTVFSRTASEFARQKGHLGTRKEFRFMEGDIRYLTELPRDTNYIIHAAALTDRRLFASYPTAVGEVNTVGTIRLLRAANLLEDVRKFVLLSSGLVHGPQALDVERIDEAYTRGFPCDNPSAIYTESKRFGEAMAAAFVSETKLPLVTLRPFAFVGPHLSLELPWAVIDFMRDTLAGSPIRIMGDGSTVRSFMYASDFAFWVLAGLAVGRPRQAYNIGSPHGIDLFNLAHLITAQVDPTLEIRTKVGQAANDTSRLVPCVDKACRELGVELTVPLPEAIRKTLQWHQTAH